MNCNFILFFLAEFRKKNAGKKAGAAKSKEAKKRKEDSSLNNEGDKGKNDGGDEGNEVEDDSHGNDSEYYVICTLLFPAITHHKILGFSPKSRLHQHSCPLHHHLPSSFIPISINNLC